MLKVDQGSHLQRSRSTTHHCELGMSTDNLSDQCSADPFQEELSGCVCLLGTSRSCRFLKSSSCIDIPKMRRQLGAKPTATADVLANYVLAHFPWKFTFLNVLHFSGNQLRRFSPQKAKASNSFACTTSVEIRTHQRTNFHWIVYLLFFQAHK